MNSSNEQTVLKKSDLLKRIFVPIDLGVQNLDMEDREASLPQFHRFISKDESAVNLTDMIQSHEKNNAEYREQNKQKVFRTQVHESRQNAIQIKDQFFIFTKIRVE